MIRLTGPGNRESVGNLPAPLPILSMLSMVFLLSASLRVGSVHAAPDRVVSSIEVGSGITDLALSAEGYWLAFVEASAGEIWILDTRSWSSTSLAPCSAAPSAVAFSGDESPWLAWVGCDDGTLVSLEMDDSGDVSTTDTAYSVSTDGYPVLGIQASDSVVYVLTDTEDGNPDLHSIDPTDGALDEESGFPSALSYSGYYDTALTGNYFIVAHGSDDVSKVDLSTGSAAVSQANLSGRDLVDIALYSENVYLADSSGGVLQFTTADNDFFILLDDEDGLEQCEALVVEGDDDEPFLLVYDSGLGEILTFSFDTSTGYPDDELIGSFEASHMLEMVSGAGYVYGGGDDGILEIMTDRPWVSVEGISPDSAVEGDEVNVTFTSDMDGDWELHLGGDVIDWDGDELASGSLNADEQVQASFTVDSAFTEGINDIWIKVESNGLVGHSGVQIDVDNPPSMVSLSADNVGFGNSLITVEFDGVDDEDLDHYDIYLTINSFQPDDYSEGGPAFDGEDDVVNPLEISAAPSEYIIYTISPLTNETTYYVAVRAVDTGGQEGPMSDVQSATPRQTVGAAGLVGESGGYCMATRAKGLFSLLFAFLIALSRRYATSQSVRVTFCFFSIWIGFLAISPSTALADDMRARIANIEIRYGPYFIQDDSIQVVYGEDGHGMFLMEAGPKIGRVFEFDIGLGFYQKMGTTVAWNDYEPSSEHSMITAWPIVIGPTFRMDFWKNQFVIPVVTMGLDYWLWRENWYVNPDVGGDDSIGGGKAGWHFGLGLDFLLDILDPGHADKLAVNTGIHDTYFVVDWRLVRVGQWTTHEALTFHGSMLTFGIKLDL